jgi:hypothetical protein
LQNQTTTKIKVKVELECVNRSLKGYNIGESGINDNDNVSKEIKPIKEFLGTAFAGFKGQEAINKLLKEKQGYVPNAFYRDDIGGIDLVWGDERKGLLHLINNREKDKININNLLENLNDIIKYGEIYYNPEKDSFNFIKDFDMVVVSAINKFIITAIRVNKKRIDEYKSKYKKIK